MQEVLIITSLVVGASLLGLLNVLVLLHIRKERDEWRLLMERRQEYEAEAPILESIYGVQ
jgi:multisubunit Na+/H+ antiporter MnhC subunit